MKKDAASEETDIVAEDTEKPKDRVRKSGCCKCINPNHPSMLTLLIYYPGNHILSAHLMYSLHMGHFCFGKICKFIYVDSFDILPSCQAKLFLDYFQLARKRTCLQRAIVLLSQPQR